MLDMRFTLSTDIEWVVSSLYLVFQMQFLSRRPLAFFGLMRSRTPSVEGLTRFSHVCEETLPLNPTTRFSKRSAYWSSSIMPAVGVFGVLRLYKICNVCNRIRENIFKQAPNSLLTSFFCRSPVEDVMSST